MTFGSLFAGIGGLDLGLERAGMECKWQVENDPHASRVLAKHWPGVRRWRDIRTFLPDTKGERFGTWGLRRIAAHRQRRGDSAWVSEWSVDLICGGFPCQDISFAGKGEGLEGKRSGLFYELARVVRTLRPRFVVLENVSALLVRGLDVVLGTLAALGYDAEWHCIPAACVGAPHIRDRVFILAYPSSLQPERRRAARKVAGAKRESETDREERKRDGDTAFDCGEDVAYTEYLGREARSGCQRQAGQRRPESRVCGLRNSNGEGLEIVPRITRDAREKLQTAFRANRSDGGQWHADPADDPQSGVGRMAHGIPNRVDRLRGLGNAVVPQVGEYIGRLIMESHPGAVRPGVGE
jgi:DNA (cytosine-5)-methyltransferase 1